MTEIPYEISTYKLATFTLPQVHTELFSGAVMSQFCLSPKDGVSSCAIYFFSLAYCPCDFTVICWMSLVLKCSISKTLLWSISAKKKIISELKRVTKKVYDYDRVKIILKSKSDMKIHL